MADCSEYAETIAKLALHVAKRPHVLDVDGVVSELRNGLPWITRDEVVNSIHEYTTKSRKPLSAIKQKISDIKKEARADVVLTRKLDELAEHIDEKTLPENGLKPEDRRHEIVKRLTNIKQYLQQELARSNPALKKKHEANIARLEKAIKDFGNPKEEPFQFRHAEPSAEVKALQAKEAGLRKTLFDMRQEAKSNDLLNEQIGSLQKHLDEGTLPQSKKRMDTRAETTRKLAEIRAHLRSQVSKSSPSQKQRLLAAIDRLQKDLREPLKPATERPDYYTDPELRRLKYQRDKLAAEQRQRIEALKPESLWTKTKHVLGVTRIIQTMWDVSAVLRQGGKLVYANITTPSGLSRTGRAFRDMMIAISSKEKAHAINSALQERPNAPMYHAAKLYFSPGEFGSKLSELEESFMSKWAGKIPGFKVSERAFSTFLNVLRADTFDAMTRGLAKGGEVTLDEAKHIAKYINVATGRGGLGSMETAATGLAQLFYSPRYVASRFQLLTGQVLKGGTGRTKRLIAKEYGKFLGGLGVVYGLGIAAGGEVETDPRSSDFGKLRFGSTRIDPLMGLSQMIVLGTRLATGETKSLSGNVRPLRGNIPYGGQNEFDVMARFVRSKLAPIPGGVTNLATGKDLAGNLVTLQSELANQVVPLTVQDIYQEMQSQEIVPGTAMAMLAMLGMGVQNYKEREHHPKRLKSD